MGRYYREIFLKAKALRFLLPAALLLVAGCAGQGVPATSRSNETAPTTSPPGPATPIAADDWPSYHKDLARSGFDATTVRSPKTLWESEKLDGDVYAEPLIVGNRVLIATEQNSVYSFELGTGKRIWKVSLGTPVSISQLGCGDIDPSGTTGTPVADPSARRLYVVARVQPNHHELFTVDITDGSIISHRMVDPTGSDPRVQQQRGALALSQGRVYIPFGGLYGD